MLRVSCYTFQDTTTAVAKTGTKKRKAPLKETEKDVGVSPVVRKTRRSQATKQVMPHKPIPCNNGYYTA